jgi:hypothetical protein
MATHLRWNLVVSLFVALLPMSVALAGGRGGGPQGAVGSALSGSSGFGRAVGGGAAAGAIGGGPPAGLIGGGIAPTNTNPTSGSGGGTLSPTVGGAPAANTGTPPASDISAGGPPPGSTDGASPSATGQAQPPVAQRPVVGIAEERPTPTTGLAVLAADGVSTRTVAARPCGLAAHETDGTTTCIGIPKR